MWLVIAVVILFILLLLVAWYFFRRVFRRPPTKDLLKEEVLMSSELFSFASILKPALIWFQKQNWEKLSVTAEDGTELKALWLNGKQDKPCMFLMHGYGALPQNLSPIARWASQKGWAVLLPYARSHGESGGDTCSLGLLESEDCRRWASLAAEKTGAGLILYGAGMGAFTALLAMEKPLPESVLAVVSDGTYSSPREILRHVMRRQLGMRVFPMLQLLCLYGLLKWKRSLGADLKPVLEAARTPVLFIHGKQDRQVPVSMTEELYKAYAGKKELYVAENAGHGAACLSDTGEYFQRLDRFLKPLLAAKK